MLIRGAEVEGRAPHDVRLAAGRIAAIAPSLAPEPGEAVIDARGGALLPGLHDHHLHLHALAAAAKSIVCGPPAVGSEQQLASALRAAAAAGDGWLRGVAYHEEVAGPLDRARLDAWVGDRPLRVQHRSGALWVLNSAALAALRIDGRASPEGLERDTAGRATGRLFRGDAWLRERLAEPGPDLAGAGVQLASFGVSGATDATATNDAATLARLCAAADAGALPQRLHVMGTPGLPRSPSPRVTRGAVKLLLDEPRLPDFERFRRAIRSAHAEDRPVAVHCVTRSELIFATEAIRAAGSRAGDRLEHAAVAPPEVVERIAELPLTVVTQPHFVAERGDAYRRDVDPADLPWLYRARGWREAGVPLAAGSDAPFGSPDPWRSIAAAVRRRTPSHAALGPAEALTPEEALALYTTAPEDPGGAPRRVEAGAVADLCLLALPWHRARERLCSADVAATWCGGELIWQRDPSPSR